jgi:hypothetical protein
MKTIPASLSLLLAASLAATAQETPAVPAPPVPPLPPVEPAGPEKPAEPAEPAGLAGTGLSGLPGGKIVVTSGSGDTVKTEFIDFPGDLNADSPLSLKFNHPDSLRRTAGPVTFMGVAVSPASQELATHLPLDPGVGLVVETVSKDSPAEKAGLQKNDILTKLNDQWLIHPVQFSVLVARQKEGDSVKLSILRKGVVQEIPVTLGKSEQGDSAGRPGTLEIGDVKIQIDGADTAPLRTIVKHLKMGGPSGDAVVEIEGNRLRIDGDQIKAMGDVTVRKMQEKWKAEEGKIKEQSQAALASALKALAQAKHASAAAGKELKEKAKQESIRQLEEALRKLKEE